MFLQFEHSLKHVQHFDAYNSNQTKRKEKKKENIQFSKHMQY